MRNKFKILIFSFLFFSFSSHGYGYLLPAKYILEIMIKHRGKYKALEINQDVQFYDGKFPNGRTRAKEMIYLRRPTEFRVDGDYSKFEQSWINQGNRSVIITDGYLTHEGQFDHSFLKELFVVENGEELLKSLEATGIDSSVVSLARKEEGLVYLIGTTEDRQDIPHFSLWKDQRLYPDRLLVQEFSGEDIVNLDIRFSEYGKNAPSWYPGLWEIFFNEVLVVQVRANRVRAFYRSNLKDELFDLREIKKQYPLAQEADRNLVISSSRITETLEMLRKNY